MGPARSMLILQGRPSSRSARRTLAMIRDQTCGPSWAQLMRAQVIPLRSSAATSPGSSAASAGMVTMIWPPPPARALPNRRSLCSPSRRAPAAKSTLLAAWSAAAGSSASLRRVASTVLTVASTWDSDLPREERPNSARSACSGRRSWRRSARYCSRLRALGMNSGCTEASSIPGWDTQDSSSCCRACKRSTSCRGEGCARWGVSGVAGMVTGPALLAWGRPFYCRNMTPV